jgi:hypothetical protein
LALRPELSGASITGSFITDSFITGSFITGSFTTDSFEAARAFKGFESKEGAAPAG